MRAGDRDADGIEIPADALSLNGGRIGNGLLDAALDTPQVRYSQFKVCVAPGISDLRLLAEDGGRIEARVAFNDLVEVTGRPTLALEVGSRRVEATFESAVGPHVYFEYDVQPGDVDRDGVAVPAGALSLDGGTIRGRGGDARLGYSGRTFGSVKVDGGSGSP